MTVLNFWTFKCQPHKMVKHTQTIRQQIADELFECVWPFCGVCAERVKGNPYNFRNGWNMSFWGPKSTLLNFSLNLFSRFLLKLCIMTRITNWFKVTVSQRFHKVDVFKNSKKLTGKHLRRVLFLTKVQASGW